MVEPIGGLGHLAVQYARLVGAKVIAVDVTTEKLELARKLGADHVVNPHEGDPVQAIRDLGGADVAASASSARSSVPDKIWPKCSPSMRRGGPG